MSFVVENLLTVFSTWIPLFGLLLMFIPEFKSRFWLIASESFLLILTAGLAYVRFSQDSGPGLFAVIFYPLSMAIMLPVFSRKYSLNRALALTMCLGFLLTGLHEVWGFIRLDLGLYDEILALKEYAVWFTPLDHLYFVAVGVMALWISRFNKYKVAELLGWFLLGLALEYIIYPHLALNLYGPWDVARRLIWLPILLFIFYRGGISDQDRFTKYGCSKCRLRNYEEI